MGKEMFSTRLKELRMQTRKTQKEFADMVESTAATISAYENATKNPSLEIVMNIAEKCNISINWLCGLSDEKNLKPEITSYKDIALRILELLSLDLFDGRFELKLLSEDDAFPIQEYVQAIKLPNYPELLRFFETYKDLNKLYEDGKIKQHVIDTWLDGALEELSAISIRFAIPEVPPEE